MDVLIPTCDRAAALAVTLTSLFAQTLGGFRVLVSDQSERCDVAEVPEVAAVIRALRASGREVRVEKHLPRRGLAEQRAFLLSLCERPRCLFVDDDVMVEPDLLQRLCAMLDGQRCGFVGSAVIGLSYAGDVRPHQQAIEFWEGPVEPETVVPDGPQWARHDLHSAANLWHVQRRLGLTAERGRPYKVAWVGGCVLYDTEKLRAVGGFEFWRRLPAAHCGEDVLAQLRVMARFGGCGVIPSGAYHQELATTVPDRRVDAPRVLLASG